MPTSFLSLVKRFAREERGASFVEYALLVALVVAAITGISATLFTEVGLALNEAAPAISNVGPGTGTGL
jgi:Flp pilus assembly pilin Flp